MESLPIRMLNEHLYCPRLFHLMHVQGLWAESGDTVEGRAQHDRAQARQPAKPPRNAKKSPSNEQDAAQLGASSPAPPDLEPDPWPATPRNLELGCPTLGIVGKLDALEEDSSETKHTWVPVEGKHSAPPELDRPILSGDIELARGAWNNDQIQLCAQGLLLRANNSPSTHGYLYYRKTRQRVRIEFDERLVEATHREIQRARQTCAAPMPPPLVDSPKCPRCSLHAICLPDETNWILQRTHQPPTGVMPARDDRAVLYLSEPGTYLSKRSHCLVIKPVEGPPREVPLKDVGHITLAGAVQASTQVLHEALDSGRSITFLTAGGRYLGGLHPPLTQNFHLRRAQYRLLDEEHRRLPIARRIVAAKILNSRTLLRRGAPDNATTLAALRSRMAETRRATTIEQLMGIEGAAARTYFPAFASLLKQSEQVHAFDWNGRTRRPPRDPINTMLSLAYALLLRDVETALRNAGLDPLAGIYHAVENGKPALALDLMEAYRPLVAESVVLRAVNTGVLTHEDFLVLPGQAAIKTPARKRFFTAYEQRMNETIKHPRFRYAISYRRTLELEARLFARHLEGELPDYTPLMTR